MTRNTQSTCRRTVLKTLSAAAVGSSVAAGTAAGKRNADLISVTPTHVELAEDEQAEVEVAIQGPPFGRTDVEVTGEVPTDQDAFRLSGRGDSQTIELDAIDGTAEIHAALPRGDEQTVEVEVDVEDELDGEISLSENEADHLAVHDHWFEWNEDDDECTIYVELEKTSADTFNVSFELYTYLYSDDGERVAAGAEFALDTDLEQGERRTYAIPMREDCEGAATYEIDLVRFGASVPTDELKPDFDLDPELEGRLEVVDSSVIFEGGGAPLYDFEYSHEYATVQNVTDDYRLSIRGPDGEYRDKTVALDPGDTADFAYTGWKDSVSMDDLTYGFEIEAESVTELDDTDDIDELAATER